MEEVFISTALKRKSTVQFVAFVLGFYQTICLDACQRKLYVDQTFDLEVLGASSDAILVPRHNE